MQFIRLMIQESVFMPLAGVENIAFMGPSIANAKFAV